MLTENDLTIILCFYIAGALTGWFVFWMMTRWVWPAFLRGQLRALVLAALVAPSPITPGGEFAAPAWVVLLMDVLRNGFITRQDAVNWLIIFALMICGWALAWSICTAILSRLKAKRAADKKLEEKRLAAAARMDDPFGDGITSPGGVIELEETPPVKPKHSPSQRLSKRPN